MKQLTQTNLKTLSAHAASVPRLRAPHNLHDTLDDPIQRLAIAMEPGTYIRPHRHPQTWELLTPLKGRFLVLQFDEQGVVTERTLLGDEVKVLEMPASTWHAVLSIEEGGVIFEVKMGPYQPVTAEHFMPWAPAEGEEGTQAVMRWYATAQVGERYRA